MTLLKLDKNQQKERENVNTTNLALTYILAKESMHINCISVRVISSKIGFNHQRGTTAKTTTLYYAAEIKFSDVNKYRTPRTRTRNKPSTTIMRIRTRLQGQGQ